MIDDRFEWDDAKASANPRKHKATFEDARQVFDDTMGLDRPDLSASYDEPRFVVTGHSGDRLLTVIYTERGDRARKISARPATRKEREDYFNQEQ